MTISGLPTTAGNEISLGFAQDGGGDPVPSSARYDIDGPGGHVSIAGDRHFVGVYTLPFAGTYSVVAHWSEYTCADGGGINEVTTPATTFATSAAKKPTVSFRATRRPKVANSVGSATLEAFLNCPPRREADKTPARIAVYYTLGGHSAPTHSSKHVVLNIPNGCWPTVGVGTKRGSARKVRIEISAGLAAFEVTAPAKADVLMEVSYGGKLIARRRGRFRPSSTGERVTRA